MCVPQLLLLVMYMYYVDLTRRNLDVDERRYLVGRGVVTEIQSNMGEYIYCTYTDLTIAFTFDFVVQITGIPTCTCTRYAHSNASCTVPSIQYFSSKIRHEL